MIKKKPEVFIMYRVKRQIGLTKELQTAVLHVGRRNPAVGVAVLDTGVSSHPDLREQILVFRDFVNEQTGAYDDSGHGTHVAGCVAGNGRLSRGIYSGMHPGCRLVIRKVLNNRGEGRIDHMIQAMEWILQNWSDRCDGIYLFANDTVLDFYPKFGFLPAEEAQVFFRPLRNSLFPCAGSILTTPKTGRF